MSRIGYKPIEIPQGVKLAVIDQSVIVEGPKGKLTKRLDSMIAVKVDGNLAICEMKDKTKPDSKAHFGLTRSLLSNMVKGVSAGFEKKLEVIGVGFRANVNGRNLELSLGFSHPVVFPIPEGITITVEKMTTITISGADKEMVGQVAARIRKFREPEPYKGKGVKYSDEVIRRKAGKAAGSS